MVGHHLRIMSAMAILVAGGCSLRLAPPVEEVSAIPPVPATISAEPDIDEEPLAEPPLAQPVAQSEESRSLERYYSRVLGYQLARGLLRVDGGGPDTPYTADTLVRNFERIAFFNEYTRGQVNLRRWNDPVRVEARFGASVTDEMRANDEAQLRKYVDRVARLIDHPIAMTTSSEPNFHVFFVSEDDRDAAVDEILELEPTLDQNTLKLLREMPRSNYCLVVAFTPYGLKSVYTRAVAIIRTEQPDLMRLSCIHEEIAQGLGLPNDYAQARPSIFNDDDEFALLTSHDENLLQMLYDDRLRADMPASEALPIARQIANELTASVF